ncbi:hypothetical protein JIN84_05100 [Luteolibacter yonseiensis]|uniref:Uncharacterized protein n=1 Tax=Luteolibacter yonseiensis TaxID=1144680 RepID=A0A934R2A7_9BACT|nr:DUF6364 family protein [Luteolibacter yonseiensis]MBK1814981.1 hypothetical protein [Luteolibacter yonseiensis]
MKTRVTVTMDPEIHRLAKQAARKRRTTVSGLIEALLQAEAAPKKGSIVSGMVGMAGLRVPAPGSDPLHEALQAKYVRG